MLTTALAARPMLRLLGWVMMIQRQKYPPPPRAKTQSAKRKALNSPKYARCTRLSIAHLFVTRVATALSFLRPRCAFERGSLLAAVAYVALSQSCRPLQAPHWQKVAQFCVAKCVLMTPWSEPARFAILRTSDHRVILLS
jgi:hypothetical protein